MKKPHSSRHALNKVMTANIVGNQRFATMVYTTTLELPIFFEAEPFTYDPKFTCKIKEKKDTVSTSEIKIRSNIIL